MIDLIRSYISGTTEPVAQLRRELKVHALLCKWGREAFPQRATLSDGSTYSFHGNGCAVVRKGIEVDFDFGSDGQVDGCDAWRLWCFVQQFPWEYPQFQDLHAIEAALESMLTSGAVARRNELDRLLHLVENQSYAREDQAP